MSGEGKPRKLTTRKELSEIAVVKLGSMDEKSYAEFVEQAQKIASEQRIGHPLLLIDVVTNENEAILEVSPQIGEAWYEFLADITNGLGVSSPIVSIPNVYLVDGDKYTGLP